MTIYIYIYKGHLINRGILLKAKKNFPINALFRIDLEQKLFKSCKNICFERIQNVYKSECTRFELRFLIKFLVAEKCNPCENYRRMCDVYREACFSQNCLQMSLIWVCYNKPESKWKSIKWKHTDSPVKKKFHGHSSQYWRWC